MWAAPQFFCSTPALIPNKNDYYILTQTHMRAAADLLRRA